MGADIPSCYEFVVAIVVSCPEDSISQPPFLVFCLTVFPLPLLWCFPGCRKCDVDVPSVTWYSVNSKNGQRKITLGPHPPCHWAWPLGEAEFGEFDFMYPTTLFTHSRGWAVGKHRDAALEVGSAA